MATKEIAAILDGMEYGADLPAATVLDAKRNGIVIVFGASDDLMEFRGIIEDEVVCYGGGIAYIDKNGLVQNKCNNKDCPYLQEIIQRTKPIRAIWDSEGYSWIYKTDIPHETFDILEKVSSLRTWKRYCRGIVFSMEDLK